MESPEVATAPPKFRPELQTFTTEELLRGITSWSNSLRFTAYELRQGRATHSDVWLADVKARIDVAVDLVRERMRQGRL